MLYLSNMLGNPVYDSTGEKLGVVSDLAISTGEMFPRITSLAFKGPGRTPFMISWRKYVDSFSEEEVRLNTESYNIRFSYLQPDEVLLARDLLDQQIVDTQGLKLVRVNDLKLSPFWHAAASSGRRSWRARHSARPSSASRRKLL